MHILIADSRMQLPEGNVFRRYQGGGLPPTLPGATQVTFASAREAEAQRLGH